MDVKAIQGEDGDRLSCPRCHGKVEIYPPNFPCGFNPSKYFDRI
jgi:hypothetical protein